MSTLAAFGFASRHRAFCPTLASCLAGCVNRLSWSSVCFQSPITISSVSRLRCDEMELRRTASNAVLLDVVQAYAILGNRCTAEGDIQATKSRGDSSERGNSREGDWGKM